MNCDEILLLEIHNEDLNCDENIKTVGDYLSKLLIKLIVNEESFNSKRPFGNSGGTSDLFAPLVKAGLVEGFIYYDGDAVCHDTIKATEILIDCIKEKFNLHIDKI